jgi:APA family basic amino acid/polyamine antiporter
MATAAVFVLRRKQPDRQRSYRTVGYPIVPLLFVFVAVVLIYFTLKNSPRESLIGLVLIAAGLPFYHHWRAKAGAKLA